MADLEKQKQDELVQKLICALPKEAVRVHCEEQLLLSIIETCIAELVAEIRHC